MNKNARHTPGPWGLDSNPRHVVRYESANEGRIVDIAIALGSFDSDEADANAHLIAAAPELLVACRLLLHRLVELDTELGDEMSADTPASYRCRELAESAIAEAEGGTV